MLSSSLKKKNSISKKKIKTKCVKSSWRQNRIPNVVWNLLTRSFSYLFFWLETENYANHKLRGFFKLHWVNLYKEWMNRASFTEVVSNNPTNGWNKTLNYSSTFPASCIIYVEKPVNWLSKKIICMNILFCVVRDGKSFIEMMPDKGLSSAKVLYGDREVNMCFLLQVGKQRCSSSQEQSCNGQESP